MGIERNTISQIQKAGGVAPAQGFQSPSAQQGTTVKIPGDLATVSGLSRVAPSVDVDLHQILAAVMLRQGSQDPSAVQSQATSPSLPVPNFRELSNTQGIPPVSKTFANHAIGLAAR